MAKITGIKQGFRSGLEESTAKQLSSEGVKYKYEGKESKVKYVKPETKHTYNPDFPLDGTNIILETKGRLLLSDRKKHILIREQHPELDIRFVFNNPNAKISKGSNTTYAMWCNKEGFKYCKAPVPQAWIDEAKLLQKTKGE